MRMLENNNKVNFDIAYPFFSGYMHTKLFSIIIKYEICDLLENEENGLHYEEISNKVKINKDSLYRLLRYFSVFNLFREDENKIFYKTNISSLFSKDPYKSIAKRYSNNFNYTLYENIEESIKNNTNFGPKALGVESYWDSFEKYPEYCKIYMDSMKSLSEISITNILQNIDFSQFKIIADIGGSHGLLIQEIIDNFKSVEMGINFDLKCVLDKSPLKNNKNPNSRISLVEGSFFESVPNSNCFILKNILHDWDDEHCIKILNTIKKSMNNDSKIIIIDFIIDNSTNYDKQSLFTDMIMLHSYNGKERTISEWNEILNKSNLKRDKIIYNITAGCQILSLKN